MATPDARFRPDIEGLRALAILLVVVYHAGWAYAGGGFLGVDIFFVLSGFLISGLLLDEVAATGTLSLSAFWARRARRLLPAAAVVTFVVLALNARLLNPFDQRTAAESARAFAAYGSNILFAARSTEYFGGGADHDPLLHSWSLSVEEQFYLLFAPAILALAAWSLRGEPGAFRRRFLVVTGAVTALSLAGCLLLVERYPLLSFYILPPRIWEFGLGALAAYVVRRATPLALPGREWIALASVASILGTVAALDYGETQPLGATTLIPTLGTVALILTGTGGPSTLVARAFATAPMRLVGRLSYSWYLWHWPMLVYLREVVEAPSLRLRVAVALLSIIPAAATYAWIESPIRFAPRLQQRTRLALAGAAVLAVTTVALASLALRHADRTLAQSAYAPIVASRELPDVYANGCHLSIAETESPACRFGPGRNDTVVVLYGDSHAAQWFPALDSVATLRGWTLYSFTKSACPSIPVTITNYQLGRRYDECTEWQDETMARIVALKPTIVVIANTRAYELVVDGELVRTDLSEVARTAWHAGLMRLLTALEPTSAHLVVLQNNPHPGFDPSRCLARHVGIAGECASYRTRGVDTVLAATERSAVSGLHWAEYVSLNQFICDGASCPVVQDGIVRYQDGNHVSVSFAESLVEEWSDLLTAQLSVP